MTIKGAPVTSVVMTGVTGVILVYGAITGRSPLSIMRTLLHGKNPKTVDPTQNISGSGSSAVASTDTNSGPPSNGTYDTAQLRSLWIQAGGSSQSSVNAACHAMQESSGNPRAISSNPDGGTNVGLWQLDTKGVGSGHSVAELQNALTNARITVQATNDGQNWSEWSTAGC